MLRKALVSTLLSAGIAGGWLAYVRFTGRRAVDRSIDPNGPCFELLLQ